MVFKPNYEITPVIAKHLMAIEAARESIATLPVTAAMLASLRESARLMATHYSTQIEGNRLTVAEVKDVIQGGGLFPGRERDESEVRNYYRAFEYVERLAKMRGSISEKTAPTIHGLVMSGVEKPSSFRDGQNVIRDSQSRSIVYLPPEANDVPALMTQLVAWIKTETQKNNLPVPVIAGLAHYQLATIHPYYDGNGRTARLLTTLILHRFGYGLKGVYSLEEYYARDLPAYYAALTIGENHNYYEGKRAEADVTPFLMYFLKGMADAFANVKAKAAMLEEQRAPDHSHVLRVLNARQRQALSLFRQSRAITSKELAEFFNMTARSARDLCAKWVEAGFLVTDNPSKKARSYRLEDKYEALITH